MQQREELRNHTLYGVGYEYLIAVKLYLVLLYLEIVAYLGEIEYARKRERIIDVEVYMEQRLLRHRIQHAVEVGVILLFKLRGFTRPQGRCLVYDAVFVGIDILAVFPLLLLAEHDRNRQETAIFTEQCAYAVARCELITVFCQMQNYTRTALGLVALLQSVFGRTVATPFDSLSTVLVREGVEVHLRGHHERRIEAQPEMAYYVGLILIFG